MNKAEVRTQFKALLNRNDCTTTLADLFIDQAMSRLQRTLRIPPMEAAATVSFDTTSPDSFLLPDDFLEFVALYYTDLYASRELVQLPIGRFVQQSKRVGDIPSYYCRFGPRVDIAPTPSADITLTLHYYATFAPLVVDTDTNFITLSLPELLTYGALSFATDYFIDERKQGYEDVFQRTYQEVVEQARMLEFSGGDMRIQPTYGLDLDY